MTFFFVKINFFGRKKLIKILKISRSCQEFFGVVKFCWEWYWTTPKNVRSGIGQLRKLLGVVLDNSQKCSEWYWTTPNNYSELSNTTPKIFLDLSNITSLADPHWFLFGSRWIRICLYLNPGSDPDSDPDSDPN